MERDNVYQVEIQEEMEGTRVDLVLSLALPETSRSFIQKLIDGGQVAVNGEVCRNKKYKVSVGEVVKLTVPEPKVLDIKAEDIPLDIVYEDDDVLVINKAVGMVVHPGPGNDNGTLVNAIMYHCGESLSSINGVLRPGIVHRIDKDTSGLLMVAKNDLSHNSLARQLAEHSITRAYNAIVYNNFIEDEGTVDKPIGRDPNNRLRQAVTDSNSRNAVTHYKVLERYGSFTQIEARLETGRTHQIRVHMAYIKHPLVGDTLYGPKKNPLGANRQMLHARLLGFVHPRTGEYMEFQSQLPEDFQKVIKRLKRA